MSKERIIYKYLFDGLALPSQGDYRHVYFKPGQRFEVDSMTFSSEMTIYGGCDYIVEVDFKTVGASDD
jgi:hypothetical protein